MLPSATASMSVPPIARARERADHNAHGEAEETDRVVGLELGADDYITKPSV